MTETFRATLQLDGRTATGIEVPDPVVERLGAGRRPPVVVTLAGHAYRSTLAVRAGVVKLPVSAEHRQAAGVAAGDEVEVTLAVDTAPRETPVPEDLAAALASAGVRAAFDALPPSGRKAIVVSVEGAKTDATRERRVLKAVGQLGGAA
jgi:hypothetical protein